MPSFIVKTKNWYESLSGSHVSLEKRGLSPEHDWRVMLTVSFMVLVCLVAIAFYFYAEVDAGRMFRIVDDNETNETKVNNMLFKKMVDDLNLRSASLERIRNGQDIPPDPSL